MASGVAATIFGAFLAVVALFQLALALGAPWGHLAMGGAVPGAYPPGMRVAALVQVAVLGLAGLIVFVRAGLVLPQWMPLSRRLVWGVVGLLAVSAVLNLITPSPTERLVWSPVALILLLSSLRVALGR
ncbi:MAG: hypothetical protein J0H01_22690 [Rhizobiales bacterium]|nr:hypothetical protein [Hyphomicrobiales bacterium]